MDPLYFYFIDDIFSSVPKGCRLPAVFSPSELPNQENLFATKAFGKQEISFTNQECNISAEISKGKDASENGRKMEALLKLVKNFTKINYFGDKAPIWIIYQSLEKIFVASLRFSLNRIHERINKKPKTNHSLQLQECSDLSVYTTENRIKKLVKTNTGTTEESGFLFRRYLNMK